MSRALWAVLSVLFALLVVGAIALAGHTWVNGNDAASLTISLSTFLWAGASLSCADLARGSSTTERDRP